MDKLADFPHVDSVFFDVFRDRISAEVLTRQPERNTSVIISEKILEEEKLHITVKVLEQVEEWAVSPERCR